jgi:Pro-kumamolisin, activation domain/Divergent InlB B-repeat domain
VRRSSIVICLLAILIAPPAKAQAPAGRAQPLITRPVDNNSLMPLPGNTRGEAKNAANDQGMVDDSMPLPEMRIQLRRPAAQEQAFEQLIEQLHDAKTPNYHHWLTGAEIGAQFGPAPSDITTISDWLQQSGFTVKAVSPSGMLIDFSGDAGQVRRVFHTEIHNMTVRGRASHANVSDPQIPVALSPAMAGILGLENIPAVAHHKRLPPRGGAHPEDTTANCSDLAGGVTGTTCYGVVPADLATIYNFNPVFNGGNTGQGQTIYMIEDTDLYANTDWTTFRSAFGLSSYTQGSLTTVHPGGCTDPGTNGDDDEATLDVEWGSAAAPSAAIVEASCGTILLAVQNTVEMPSPPPIMSISYGDCEAQDGETTNHAFYLAFQQGVAEGMSIFGATGDHGPDDCEDAGDNTPARGHDGLGVDGWSSTPYNVAVGGTDFSPVYSGTTSTYWSSTDSANFGSAKSYIPEMAWNGDCSSSVIAAFYGYSDVYTFCNSQLHGEKAWKTYPFSSGGGEGGQSGCATGTPNSDTPLVVSGTCVGYAKPSWQNVLGNIYGDPSNDSVRDTPDVSLFASWDVWNVGYVVCFTDPNNGGLPCTGNSTSTWWNGGGTSFATPIWAGIQALINTATGTSQGLPTVRLYQLAAAEYGSSGNSSCNSSNGNAVGSSCIFYDVTLGDSAEPCYDLNGTFYDCYDPGGTNDTGVISANYNNNTQTYTPAYQAGTGWDFVSGIGTVNVSNLVSAWALGGASSAELTVNVTGTGTIISNPSSIDCTSGTCDASYGGGTMVTLSATPGNGLIFTGWSGACSGTTNCIVTMSAAENVTATFTQGLTRTFVSSSGVDSNPCTIAAPCATFARAFPLTDAGGVLAALDPGKYGALTITYPVTINGNGWSAITAPAQGNGITINAVSGNVLLSGLEVDGAGAAYNGIVFNSGTSLTVSNSIVKDFISSNSTSGNGIMIAPTSGAIDFTIVNTIVLNNGSAGIHYFPANGSATAIGAVDHVTTANNAIGMAVDLSATSAGSAAVTISNSIANNNTADGVVTASAAGTVTVTVDRDEISSNGTGVSVGANTTVLLSRTVIAKNSTYGISNSGTAASSGDNRISGNGSSDIHGTALTSVVPQ